MSLQLHQAHSLQPVAPGHSFLFGHLVYLKNTIDALAEKGHYQYALGDIARHHFSKEGDFYLDLWPFKRLFLTAVSAQVAVQYTLTNSNLAIGKPDLLPRSFKPITDGPSLFDRAERMETMAGRIQQGLWPRLHPPACSWDVKRDERLL